MTGILVKDGDGPWRVENARVWRLNFDDEWELEEGEYMIVVCGGGVDPDRPWGAVVYWGAYPNVYDFELEIQEATPQAAMVEASKWLDQRLKEDARDAAIEDAMFAEWERRDAEAET